MKVILKANVFFNGKVHHKGSELEVKQTDYEKLKEYVDKVEKEVKEPKEPKEKK